MEREGLLGGTGLKSLEHFATWQLGVNRGRARELTAIAARLDDLPVTTGLLRDGLLSADQVAVIAKQAPAGADQGYAELAQRATVAQLQRALRAERTRPDQPDPPPAPPAREVSV